MILLSRAEDAERLPAALLGSVAVVATMAGPAAAAAVAALSAAGAAAAAAVATAGKAAEAGTAKYVWLELLSLRDVLRWCEVSRAEGVQARLAASAGRVAASAVELENLAQVGL